MPNVRHYLAWLLAPLLLVLPWAACGDPPFVDNESGAARPCDTTCDCYSGDNYELGTRCIEGFCTCPVDTHARTPCCKKGDPLCNRQCRPIEECANEDGGVGTEATSGAASGGGATGSGSSSSSGVAPDAECKTAEDCPTPGDPRCGAAQCVEGACRLTFEPVGKLASQIRGDCVSDYCDGAGNIASLPDGEDVYNDGQQCTIDTCKKGMRTNTPYPDSAPCPETGSGVCFQGTCVVCIQELVDCVGAPVCVNTNCVPTHCVNSTPDKNLGETDTDCGGPCQPCFTGATCALGSDCIDGVCSGITCQPSSCSDGVTNDHETGIDCGGPPSCPRCSVGKGCQVSSDCQSGVCWAGVCEPTQCNDGLKNGDENGTDCGGPCPACP